MAISGAKPTITVNIGAIKLRIIRVGKSPGLKKRRAADLVTCVHTHFTYEVFFVTHGSLEIHTPEKNLLCENKIVIIPPDTAHSTYPDQDGCYCLLFSVEKPKNNNAGVKYLNSVLKDHITELELSEDMTCFIRAFSKKSDENTPSSEHCAALLGELIFCEIIEKLTHLSVDSNGKKPGPWCVGAIETFINANLTSSITLSGLASHVHLSTRQISRIIKREYSIPLSRLVAEKRLASAAHLLETTNLKIKEIAQKVNLGSENYFFELFKKKYGSTPLEYRKKKRELCGVENDEFLN